jgi:hypothetical protein
LKLRHEYNLLAYRTRTHPAECLALENGWNDEFIHSSVSIESVIKDVLLRGLVDDGKQSSHLQRRNRNRRVLRIVLSVWVRVWRSVWPISSTVPSSKRHIQHPSISTEKVLDPCSVPPDQRDCNAASHQDEL